MRFWLRRQIASRRMRAHVSHQISISCEKALKKAFTFCKYQSVRALSLYLALRKAFNLERALPSLSRSKSYFIANPPQTRAHVLRERTLQISLRVLITRKRETRTTSSQISVCNWERWPFSLSRASLWFRLYYILGLLCYQCDLIGPKIPLLLLRFAQFQITEMFVKEQNNFDIWFRRVGEDRKRKLEKCDIKMIISALISTY